MECIAMSFQCKLCLCILEIPELKQLTGIILANFPPVHVVDLGRIKPSTCIMEVLKRIVDGEQDSIRAHFGHTIM